MSADIKFTTFLIFSASFYLNKQTLLGLTAVGFTFPAVIGSVWFPPSVSRDMEISLSSGKSVFLDVRCINITLLQEFGYIIYFIGFGSRIELVTPRTYIL